ncbi:MAG: SDR family oxidoreductase [Rhodothermales bacterium]|nr:SDR family oxidoreductase [Rhodothermales bacterium]
MSVHTVSVLGCGWLGLPLAEQLARRGLTVRGSTTTPEKKEPIREAGADPHLVRVGRDVEGDDLPGFFGVDLLVFTLPPSGSDDVPYPDRAAAVHRAAEAHGTGWVIMTSSTSVYPDLDRTVTETDAGAEPGLPLHRHGPDVLAAERALASNAYDLTVLRLAGLYGYGRHPARYFAGRHDIPDGDAPVNLVHRDDVIGAIEAVLEREARGEIFNVCAEAHPARRHLYPAAAQRLGLEPPTFADGSPAPFKRVSCRRLKERLDYRHRYPDPMEPAP